ncbi:hypothetical protein JOL79_16260 [Microbispora sp. RL4-1S]|uniref:Trypsin-like serine protease n=1 Tax=Microbispora oryzae TaxID=2806554 RepID=A0A940WQZ8_9ACTN|nr:hypothetical protein [Microbispora oryzae]MBP2705369.1 hypothetical protein [Microbispora oryzae]
MKRILALGGISAGLLAAAVVATPAHADSDTKAVPLASTNMAAREVASFWYGQAKANLINATPYNVETQVAAKHVSTGGAAPDSKPGIVPAIGDEKKSTSTSKNVNLPKTTGKVFFVGADHKPHWCTATSVQSTYHNLVATAGHCVYDTESNKATLDRWVFVPGYYQGKTPWGIYVGKTAYTHYDYDVYEDGDRDYAFVTVYNGVLPTSASGGYSQVFETEAEAKAEQAKIESSPSTVGSHLSIMPIETNDLVPFGTPGSKKVATTFKDLGGALNGGNLAMHKVGFDQTEISKYAPEIANKPLPYVTQDGKTRYDKKFGDDRHVWKQTNAWKNVDLDYKLSGPAFQIGLKDVGRLGDNVGGQGLAYNQKIGSSVFVFGYPSGSHPDGNHAYTGKTLKWSYGKTFKASSSAMKAEELVGVKSSFTGEGSIGSSWLLQYKSSRRLGYLNGVTIGVSDTDKNGRIDTSVSPYFDGETYGVYSAAKANWSGKIV